jgi:REP element-mobilizing transposase RayT
VPRIHRCDCAGAWFHIVNRGIARRPIFETARDVRYFLSCVARAVRRGWIEVHSFCVMTTHYHLLARSPCGRISDAMRAIQNTYARWFNRSRLRDGPVFRGRFRSARVHTLAHRTATVAYIDRNPLDARIVASPSSYPHGSAARFARARGPRWLDREIVGGILAERGGAIGQGPLAYDRAVFPQLPEALTEFIESRLQETPPQEDDPTPDPLDDLIRAAPGRVQAWMQRKAGLADATMPGVAILASSTVLGLVSRRTAGTARVRLTERSRPAADLLAAGLLRTTCGQTFEQIGVRAGCGAASAKRRTVEHLEAMRSRSDYAALAARIVTEGLATDFPPPRSDTELPRHDAGFPGLAARLR